MAKNYLIIFITLITIACYSQDEKTLEKKEKTESAEKIKPKEYFRLYYIHPNGIGDNVIAKANEPGGGIGVGITFGIIGQVHIIGGGELTTFSITDKSLAGNANDTNIQQLYLLGLYKFSVNKMFEVNPGLSIGTIRVNQKRNSKSIGRQNGFCITPTVTADLRLTNISFFIGLNYNIAFLRTNTHPEYKDFFGKIQMISLIAGIKF
ncbi:hypothetical protein GCM10007424_01210 [Flavobacterium suaedae]|uniref:Outer membrane protein beta-barrel domain-containing protein n=1 Tax=Flavobacterium suaedae TaxID=1767027 RepID=A0ABQ1JFG7_9FLAO|nr:hypothetical protein [Flavobacterium suaedae]GGB65068.1 hypothetical protein GCM10007424_01210 [Flavobacterium suaedae]